MLALGAVFAVVMLLARTPALAVAPAALYYQALTGHGLFMFIFWLAFVQTGFLLGAGSALIGQPLRGRAWAWVGFWMMLAAAALALGGVLSGAAITYHGAAPLAQDYPTAWLIYLGFVVLALGMLLQTAVVAATVLGAVGRVGRITNWAAFFKRIPIATFAAVAGLFIAVPGLVAALKTFTPALVWSLGWGPLDAGDYRLNWHVAFHIYHYIPALALVGVAYVLAEVAAGARSVYPKPLAKGLFLLYPLLVPPTFLYHLLADPGIPQGVKLVGTTLSLLVGVPTLLHMFVIAGMLEARYRGARNWLRRLPWSNPAFAALAMGLVTLFVGGVLSYLALQEPLAPLLHNTFAVPAYVHAVAAGGANLAFMGALFYALPVLLRRPLRGMRWARVQPWIMGAGLLWMTAFGVIAGLAGALRRTPPDGGGAPWDAWLNLSLGVGGGLALLAVIVFLGVAAASALPRARWPLEQALEGLIPRGLPPARKGARTSAALIPLLAFVVAVVALSVWAIHWLKGLGYGG